MSSVPHAARPPLARLASGITFAVLAALLIPQAKLRLPFDVLPGGVYVALLGLPMLWRYGGEADSGADLQVAAYGGTNYTMRSRLHLTQPGGTDLRFKDIAWEGQPFRAPPYYGLRAIYWLPASRLGIMGDFTHIKARALRGDAVEQSGQRDGSTVPPQQPLSATFKRLEFTHGYNLLTLNLVRRADGGRTRFIPYAGAGLGVAYPHVEVQRAGAPDATRTYAYQILGPALQLLGGIEWRFGRSRRHDAVHASAPGGTRASPASARGGRGALIPSLFYSAASRRFRSGNERASARARSSSALARCTLRLVR
jgi:hypothetical protein